MAKIGTIISTWLFGKKVGEDQFGNCYYISKSKNTEGKNKRIVIYKGISDPSKVPAMWHGWLHYMIDELPNNEPAHDWSKQHAPNVTGTKYSYKPDAHIDNDGKRKKVGADYQSWKPSE
jgi:NADH:ubiquinone oxidoreductase subunit